MPKSKTPPPKRHHSERFRFPGATAEKWTHAQAALAAFMHAQNFTSTEIAEALGNGVIASTVRAMVRRRWGLPSVPKGKTVTLPPAQVKKLQRLAAERGMTPERYLARICHFAIRDDLFGAIVPPGGE